MNKKNINKKIYFRLGATVLFSIFFAVFAFPINIFGVTRESKIILNKGVNLVSSPECDLVDKDKLPSRFYTVEDLEGNKYFCLNEEWYYPSDTEYELENSIEVTSDSVRWLIYNYNYNSNYFAGVNDLTAYGATQIAIWHYTENREGTPDYEKNNPLVMQLIQDSANVDFPSLEKILSSYEAIMQVESPMLELEGDEYVGQFTVSVNSNITHENATVEIVPSDFTVRNGLTTIHDDEGVNIQEVSSGVYSIRINKELIDPNDPVTIGYYANVTGEALVALEAFPNAVITQSVGYTDTITLSKPISAYTVFEIDDIKVGKIEVTKVDQNNNSIQGAEFTLTDNEGNQITLTTKDDGRVSFVIDEGETYTLEETKTPDGYTGSFKQEGITLENDGQIFTYTAVNKLKEGNIQVTKVDQNNQPVQGAEFVLTDNENNYVIGVSDEQGLIAFNIEANKTYSLEESKTPDGYTGSFKQEGITLENDGQIFTYTAVNKLKEGSIQVTKVDQNNQPVQGAEFVLTDNENNYVIGVSDEQGLIAFDIEANKTYSLEESKTPDGYAGSFKQEGITLENDGQIFTYTAVNKLKEGSIQVTKVDQNNQPVQGAEFVLTDNENNYVIGVSDEQGLIAFNIEANKTYSLEESKTPDGYTGTFKQEGITLENDDDMITYHVVNQKVQDNSSDSRYNQDPEDIPSTGDSAQLSAWMTIFIGSILTILGLLFYPKNSKKKR